MKTPHLICAATALSLLAACGGGHDGAPPAGNDVPASATASPAAYSAYVGSRPPDDRAEPLNLDGLEVPASETDEPVDVI